MFDHVLQRNGLSEDNARYCFDFEFQKNLKLDWGCRLFNLQHVD